MGSRDAERLDLLEQDLRDLQDQLCQARCVLAEALGLLAGAGLLPSADRPEGLLSRLSGKRCRCARR